jgi:peptidoglycan/LPS O-acetylase OafA/YrhL
MVDLPRRRSLGRDDDRLRPDLDAVGLAGIGSHVARTGLARAFHDGDQPSDVPTPVDRRGAERVPGAMPPDPQDDLRVRAPSARSRTAAVPGARTAGARALPPLELATAELPAVASFEPTRRRRRRSEPRFDHGLEHRPHLDGLRGLAVVVIVLANSGIGLFRHGDIGIDVAFVVAGFLLTGVVLRDVIDGSGTGAERLVRFYARRLRSTVPILVINLIATAVLYRAIAPDGTADATRRGLRSAALFVANLFYAGAHGSGPVQGPTGQYWVVSAAGQFTFLLPWLFIGGLVWFGRWRMPMVIAAIAGASVLAALVTAAFNADRSYFSAPTRIYQFLAGALVALLIDKIRDRLPLDRVALVVPVALGTLLVLATPLVPLPAVLRGIVAVAVAAAVAIVAAGEVAPDAPGPRALAAPSAAYLGRIAYGTFLWHWILLLIVAANWSLSPWVTAAATLPVALGLAALGHELIERPLRDAEVIEDRDPIFIGVAVLTLLLVGVLIAPALAT